MNINLQHLYLIAPLHTGGTTQEGNLLGIARESHTNFPYIPSSTIRGKLRSSQSDDALREQLFGNELKDGKPTNHGKPDDNDNAQLTQGDIWIGDGSILWLPIPSLSHGVVWVSCPLLLHRYARLAEKTFKIEEYLCKFKNDKTQIYLKDAIFKGSDLKEWPNWKEAVPGAATQGIDHVLVLPDQHCGTIIQMGLWRQVKIKLDSNKTVDGGFRYEEAIPPDTLMYFPWGLTSQAKNSEASEKALQAMLSKDPILQIGGQESLGRGFVQSFA
ncbi:type III-B CRISPR module RAMP protein Cmr4 [Spirulina sp. CCNP1310]|uniref:type III-B CRISPR module RAMP protein Cmr4 n=1 Tax=Spirulina sp. CCNP1310 TaxID=3110249 RepID=UPI002B2048FC|nr:type III-B CRISPR module RAMP protein Cmr4 [Spirulina sp. CCNP1310]MEA5421095.1 type III-B CRISPR module RAMP protein Cmr4 [Spirulina sp. CCNP1310]